MSQLLKQKGDDRDKILKKKFASNDLMLAKAKLREVTQVKSSESDDDDDDDDDNRPIKGQNADLIAKINKMKKQKEALDKATLAKLLSNMSQAQKMNNLQSKQKRYLTPPGDTDSDDDDDVDVETTDDSEPEDLVNLEELWKKEKQKEYQKLRKLSEMTENIPGLSSKEYKEIRNRRVNSMVKDKKQLLLGFEDNKFLRRTLAGMNGGVSPDPDGDVEALQQQVRDLKDTVHSLQEKNNELYKVNYKWSEQYKYVHKAMTDRIKTLETEKEALTKHIAKMDSENQDQDASIETALRKLRGANAMLQKEKEDLTGKLETTLHENFKLNKRITTLEKLYNEDVNEELAAKDQIRELGYAIKEFRNREEKNVNEFSSLQDRYTETQDQLRKYKELYKTEQKEREKELKRSKKEY